MININLLKALFMLHSFLSSCVLHSSSCVVLVLIVSAQDWETKPLYSLKTLFQTHENLFSEQTLNPRCFLNVCEQMSSHALVFSMHVRFCFLTRLTFCEHSVVLYDLIFLVIYLNKSLEVLYCLFNRTHKSCVCVRVFTSHLSRSLLMFYTFIVYSVSLEWHKQHKLPQSKLPT